MSRFDVTQALEAVAYQSLYSNGYLSQEAMKVSKIIAQAILDHFRAQQVYFPKGGPSVYRDQEIYHRANGSNTADLAREYGLSKRHVEKIIAKGRKTKGCFYAD